MIQALGFSSSDFNPSRPGRLCRGRERWIQAWEQDEVPMLHRLVVSGARFSDDSARDAQRGLNCAGVQVGRVMELLFGDSHRLLAFREEGTWDALPEALTGHDEDLFRAARRGGAFFEGHQRWRAWVEGAEAIDALVGEDNVDGIAVLPAGSEMSPELDEALYLLTGMGDGSALPVRRFQPVALLEVLQHCEALVCLHLDKHGPALGVYTTEPLDKAAELTALAREVGVLAVPFAIPPMLARWDRALQELRTSWDEETDGEFPVPPAEEPTRWSRGRGRSRNAEE